MSELRARRRFVEQFVVWPATTSQNRQWVIDGEGH